MKPTRCISRGLLLAFFFSFVASASLGSQGRGRKKTTTQGLPTMSTTKPSKRQKIAIPLTFFTLLTFVALLLLYRFHQKKAANQADQVAWDVQKDKLTQAQNQIKQEKNALDTQEKRRKTLQEEVHKLQQSLPGMKKNVPTLLLEAKNLDQEDQKLTTDIEKVANEATQFAQKNAITQQEVKTAKQKIDAMEKELLASSQKPPPTEANKQTAKLQQENEQLKKKLDEFRSKRGHDASIEFRNYTYTL